MPYRTYRPRFTDARLLIIFIIGVVLLGLFGTYVKLTSERLDAFRRDTVANCLGNQKNTEAFNNFIGLLQTTTVTSSLLSDQEKAERVGFYQQGKQAVPVCPVPPTGSKIKPRVTPPPPAPPVSQPSPKVSP